MPKSKKSSDKKKKGPQDVEKRRTKHREKLRKKDEKLVHEHEEAKYEPHTPEEIARSEICDEVFKEILAQSGVINWQPIRSAEPFYNAFKRTGIPITAVADHARIGRAHWDDTMTFYPEFHLHQNGHHESDKIRLFNTEPPILAYEDFPSVVQPCYPRKDDRYLNGRLYPKIIIAAGAEGLKFARPKANEEQYNIYDNQMQAAYAYTPPNDDFYTEFGIVRDSNIIDYQFIPIIAVLLVLFVLTCLICNVFAFLIGMMVDRYIIIDTKDKNEPV